LISKTESNDSIRPLLTRPDRGRPTSSWLVGSCRQRHIKRWGARRTRYEVHRAPQPPTNTTYRSRLGARPTGSFSSRHLLTHAHALALPDGLRLELVEFQCRYSPLPSICFTSQITSPMTVIDSTSRDILA
jgi:hypothetical protein